MLNIVNTFSRQRLFNCIYSEIAVRERIEQVCFVTN